MNFIIELNSTLLLCYSQLWNFLLVQKYFRNVFLNELIL